jgi:ketosteroid isomerase-like protein
MVFKGYWRRMAREHPNAQLIRDFHDAQNRFYAGGDQAPAGALLTADVAWHVPGRSAIAGDYRGRDEVLRYFAARRDLAQATFRITVRSVLADDERAVIFAGGEVQRNGHRSTWETVSVFRIDAGKIAECWVLPYDQYAFDAIWSAAAS